ncbi:unnamed protein product [Musa textilis]
MSDDNKSSAQGGEGSARRELGGSQSGTSTTGEYQAPQQAPFTQSLDYVNPQCYSGDL